MLVAKASVRASTWFVAFWYWTLLYSPTYLNSILTVVWTSFCPSGGFDHLGGLPSQNYWIRRGRGGIVGGQGGTFSLIQNHNCCNRHQHQASIVQSGVLGDQSNEAGRWYLCTSALVGWSNNCYFGNTQFLSSLDCETMLGWSILPVASGQLLVGRQEAFVMAWGEASWHLRGKISGIGGLDGGWWESHRDRDVLFQEGRAGAGRASWHLWNPWNLRLGCLDRIRANLLLPKNPRTRADPRIQWLGSVALLVLGGWV